MNDTVKTPASRFLIDGAKLQAARRARGWTVRELETQLGGALARVSLYRIERGVTGVHEATMFALAAVLGLEPLALAPDPAPEPQPNAGQTPRTETETEA